MEAGEHAWETCKENVQPIKTGRSTKGLSGRAGAGACGAGQAGDEERGFEASLSAIASRNPQSKELLDVYAQYFKWSRDAFPSSSDKAQSVLERATADLKDSSELKNDAKFVKMWIEYADMVRTPGEIFSFMQSNKIGEKVALFWIAWAFVAEKAENFKLTDQIFQKGLQKVSTIKEKERHDEAIVARAKAEKDLLSKRYQQFQRRLARHYLNLAEAAASGEEQIAVPQAHSERVALGGLRSGDAVRQPSNENAPLRAGLNSGRSSQPAPRAATSSSSFPSTTTAPSSSASSSSSSSSAFPGTAASVARNNFQIFSDSPASSAVPAASTGGFQIFSDDAPQLVENPAWTQLAPQRVARKENEDRATKWTEGGLRPASAATFASAVPPPTVTIPAIPIFCDPDEQGEVALPMTDSDAARSRGVRFDLDGASSRARAGLAASLAPAATVDPLQRHKASAATSAAPAAPAAAPAAVSSAAATVRLIVPGTAPAPAPAPAPKVAPQANAPTPAVTGGFQIFSDSPCGATPVPAATAAATTAKANTTAARQEQSELDALLGDLGILDADAEDGTINTRLARQHIDALFLSPSQSPPPVASASLSMRPVAGASGQAQSTTRLFTHFNTTADLSAIKESSNEHSHFNVSNLHFGATPTTRHPF